MDAITGLFQESPAALSALLGSPRKARIGLFGGSFNPAHEGHRHISIEALKRLQLDEIWWLVSPQNPLKSADDMADFESRRTSARRMADHPRIRVLTLEKDLGIRHTWRLVKILKTLRPGTRWIYIIGDDNWLIFHRWQNWRYIIENMPVAIFARPEAHAAVHQSRAAKMYEYARLFNSNDLYLSYGQRPAWIYVDLPRHPASSTAIRKRYPRWWELTRKED